ncbi:MAG: L,D-transpeptidase family protein [Magnetococcales bacterium]|nr:L,D-transpeptidase family protein [Magnetococcales bacterium]
MKDNFLFFFCCSLLLFLWSGSSLSADKIEIEEKRLLSYSEIFANRLQAMALIPRRFALQKDDELIGNQNMQHLVKADETLMELARVYGMGFNEITLANPDVDPWEPKLESRLIGSFIRILPGLDRPADIIINIPEMRLYHRVDSGFVDTYAIGVGREGFITPTADTRLIRKQEKPSWFVPLSIRQEKPELSTVVKPGPENPLGSHALYLALPGYLLHGTNQPLGIGRRVSHGCIRLYPEDVTEFFANAKIGASVRLVHEPVKAGWRENHLYLEVFPLFTEEIAEDREKQLAIIATTVVNKALSRRPDLVVQVDWRAIDRLVHQPDGMPHLVGEKVNDSDIGIIP